MKIGMITDTWAPLIDGVAVSTAIYKEALEALGHEVWIIAPALPGDALDPPETIRLRNLPWPPYPAYRVMLPWPRGLRLADIGALGLDVLHVQSPFGAGLIGLYLGKKYNIPTLHSFHTFWDQYLHYMPGPVFMYRDLYKILARALCNAFPLILTPGEATREWLLRHGVRSPVEILPNALDLQRMVASGKDVRKEYGLSKSEELYASAGRLGPEKNFKMLIEAFALFRAQTKKGTLMIMGGGDQGPELKKVARAHGLEKKIIFTGWVSRQKLVDTLAEATMFCFASVSETQGLVVLEALAVGTPVVAVDALGPGETLKGNRGGLLAKANARDLAEKMLLLRADSRLYALKKKEAPAIARRSSALPLAKKLLAHYNAVIRRFSFS